MHFLCQNNAGKAMKEQNAQDSSNKDLHPTKEPAEVI